jgi:hypothetical protein
LLAGYRFTNIPFGDLGIQAWFWGSAHQRVTDNDGLSFSANGSGIGAFVASLVYGFSIRCIKD